MIHYTDADYPDGVPGRGPYKRYHVYGVAASRLLCLLVGVLLGALLF